MQNLLEVFVLTQLLQDLAGEVVGGRLNGFLQSGTGALKAWAGGAAKGLKASGADVLVLACNTLHTVADAIEGATAFMSWMGPSPVDILEDDYFSQWAELFSIGTFALLRNASEDFLAAGDTDSEVSADIRHAVSDWYSYGDDLEAQYALLRAAHADLGDYSMDIVPRLKELNAAGVTQSGLVSRFPFDIAAVLSDPNMESRLAIYLIRMEFVRRQALDLLERQAILKALVQQATGE